MKKRNYFSDIEDRNENAFSVIADFEGNEEQLMDIEVDEILPVLPLRNMVLFPGDVDRFSSSFFFINTGHTLSQAPQAIHADRSIITGNSNPALSFFI